MFMIVCTKAVASNDLSRHLGFVNAIFAWIFGGFDLEPDRGLERTSAESADDGSLLQPKGRHNNDMKYLAATYLHVSIPLAQ